MAPASNDGRGPAWYVKIPFLVGCALMVLAAPIWLPLLYPAALLVGGLHSLEERRFLRRMRKRGRFIEWADLEPALEAGEGTLVFEQGFKAPVRVWWTPDDLIPYAPCPPPSEDEMEALTIKKSSPPHPFVAWCDRMYTNEDKGTARLTLPPDLPDGCLLAGSFRDRYPGIRAVDTVYHSDRWYDAGAAG